MVLKRLNTSDAVELEPGDLAVMEHNIHVAEIKSNVQCAIRIFVQKLFNVWLIIFDNLSLRDSASDHIA